MSKWQINPIEYFSRLEFNEGDFQRELALPNIGNITEIIPLREIKVIHSLIPISRRLLEHLIRHIRTMDGQLPFGHASIRLAKIDPNTLRIGQRFCYREKYIKLLEDVPGILNGFAIVTGGLFDLGAYFAFGLDSGNRYVMACYIPPLIELHPQGFVIMDGIHRNFIGRQTGTTVNGIIISGVTVPFSCESHSWDDVSVIPLSEKPNLLENRYFGLKKELFRDLKYLGIDG